MNPSIEQAAGEAGSDALGALLRVALNDDGTLQGPAVQSALGGSNPVADGQNVEISPSGVTRYIPTGPIRRLHTLFSPLVCDLAVGLRPNGTDYELLYGWGGNRYWRTLLALESTNPGSYPLHQIQETFEATPMLSVLGSDASVTRGAGVTGPSVQAAAYGGNYYYGTAAAQTFTFVTPAGATRVGWRGPTATNGGAAVVSIDGDKTAANLLPTAQQMVNQGAYPSTILVSGGGTVNPTDRILDTYAQATVWDFQVGLAEGLNAAAHTVVLTPIGTARTVGGGNRVYFSGYGYATASTSVSTANVVTYSQVGLMSPWQASAWEYALKTGGTFFGNVHGYDVEDSIAVTVDGASTTLVAGQIASAVDVLEITRTSHLVNPANTAQTIATVTTVYHLDRDGLRVSNTINWSASLTIQGAYVMAALNGPAWERSGRASLYEEVFDGGSLLNYPLGPLAFDGSSDLYYPNNGVKTEAAWIYGGNYGLLMWLPNVNQWTNNWTNAGVYARIEDRSGSINVTKIYFPRITDTAGTEAVNSGDTWRSTVLYLMGRFPSGAATVIGA